MGNDQERQASSDEKWLTENACGVELRGRIAPGEQMTVVWPGRADADKLEGFIFDVLPDAPVKATGWMENLWKESYMLEVSDIRSRGELSEHLSQKNETLENAYFLRFEGDRKPGTNGDSPPKIVVWSKQGPFDPKDLIDDDGADGVGVYIEKNRLRMYSDKLLAFVRDTCREPDCSSTAFEKAFERLLGSLYA